MNMTPLHLKMLLHYHCIAEPYAMRHPEHANSPAVKKFLAELLGEDLIKPIHEFNRYITTERGKAFIEALLDMPLPIHKWIIPT